MQDPEGSPKPILRYALDRPDSLPGPLFDQYLDAGWFRQGQGMFTVYGTIARDQLRATPWLRVDTGEYKISKNLRRLRSKNGRRLTCEWGDAQITDEHLLLFLEFRSFFKGTYYEDLHETLYSYQKGEADLFQTQEIRFYEEGELVGYCFFDVGENSIMSLLTIYSKEACRHSIGMYAILLQLEWARENGKQFYYPGYAIHGNPRFDYKLRIGGMEYLDQRDGLWRPWAEFDPDDCPLSELRRAIDVMDMMLSFRSNEAAEWYPAVYLNHTNPCVRLMDEEGAEFLCNPLYLVRSGGGNRPFLIDYDLETSEYRFIRAKVHAHPPFPDDQLEIEEWEFPVRYDIAKWGYVGLMTVDQEIFRSRQIDEVADQVRKLY